MASTFRWLDLTTLDQTMLRVYVRQLLVFPFLESNYESEAIIALRDGLLATLRQYPFLAGTIEETDPFTGAMAVEYPKDINADFVSQMLKVNYLEDISYDYEILCKDGSHPGLDDSFAEGLTTFANRQRIPVFAAQVNFIPGGLVISAYTHHGVVDGTGIAKIYQAWSGHIQAYERQETTSIQVDAEIHNNARRALETLILNATPMDLPEFRYPTDPAPVPSLRDTAYKLRAKILVFSASTIAQLATSLSTATKERISMFTALTALRWCHVTNTRRAAIAEKGIQQTKLGTAIDHRKRVGSLIPNDYIGNCANGMIVSLPLSTMPTNETMDDEHIAVVALAISNGLSAINLDWFRARLLHLSKQSNPSKLVLNVDTRNGPDIFITSWMHMGADDVWAIPGTAKRGDGSWGCKPTAIRKPQCANEGGMQILPRQREGNRPFEVLVALEEGEMERTVQSLQEGRWVERVVDG